MTHGKGGGGAAREMRARAAAGPFDIKWPPAKKHMLMGHLVPAPIARSKGFFHQKHRRVALEILEPVRGGGGGGGTNAMATHAWDPENETLHDHDQVVLRFFRHTKKKKSSGNGKDSHDSDEEDGAS